MLHNSPKLLHRIALTATFMATTWMGAAFAQTMEPEGANRSQEITMEKYLSNHPEQAKQLHENPALINDPAWLAKNPSVGSFMAKHPDFKADAARDPQNFVGRSERVTMERDHHALNNSTRYLDKHPEMRQELSANPKLIDDPKYLAAHPGLEKELKSHPEIRDEAMNHPEEFKKAMERNTKYNEHHRSSTGTHPTSTGAHKSTTAVKKTSTGAKK